MATIPNIRTPWGMSDHATAYRLGVISYGTPSHGGFKVPRDLNAQIPAYMRKAGGWYEEDCDWCIPVIALPLAFERCEEAWSGAETYPQMLESAKATLRNWHPDAYETFYGVVLVEGESVKRDDAIRAARNVNEWVVTAARGDWAVGVPDGFVGVCARLGGRDPVSYQFRNTTERHFLVPSAEYSERGAEFIIDLNRHIEIAPLSGASKERAA